jgi:hypothetical protein
MSKQHTTLDKDIFWRLIEISTALSSERNKARLFEKILDAAQDITSCRWRYLVFITREKWQTST